MKFPTLYKKTSTGAIQFWEIQVTSVIHPTLGIPEDGKLGHALIVTKYGQEGTDSPQLTHDRIENGKNTGKKNATTPKQQAELEAKAKWEKQKKKGYVESIEAAQNDELDDLIEGGVVPMLAHKFSEQAHKIKYPAYVQPKLDGIRCVAIVKDGVCTLWSRTRKPITSCPHIIAELEAAFQTMDVTLDGELYNHEMKKDFEKIVSLVRQEEPGEGHEIVQYHVYDMVCDMPFEARTEALNVFFGVFEFHSVKQVLTEVVNSEEEVMNYFDKYVAQGYEGAMLRNADSKYVNKRSYDLQKVKEFQDDEFKIIGIDEGRGKLKGHVGAFVCVTADGQEFLTKMSGETAKLKEYFDNHDLWKDQILTVQYQGLTSYGIPRFPVGLRLRLDNE